MTDFSKLSREEIEYKLQWIETKINEAKEYLKREGDGTELVELMVILNRQKDAVLSIDYILNSSLP